MKPALEDYRLLLERFLHKEMSAKQFQTEFLDKFKNETRQLDLALFDLLDTLFGDVDSFCSEPELLAALQAETPGFYLDEQSLRNRVFSAWQSLLQLTRV